LRGLFSNSINVDQEFFSEQSGKLIQVSPAITLLQDETLARGAGSRDCRGAHLSLHPTSKQTNKIGPKEDPGFYQKLCRTPVVSEIHFLGKYFLLIHCLTFQKCKNSKRSDSELC